MATARPYHVLDGYSFLAYPNRDSVPFREFYQIPEAHTVIRGSLRYKGNPALVKALIDLGWLDTEQKAWLKDGMTWSQLQQGVTGASSSSQADLITKVKELCKFSSSAEQDEILSGLRWMGLFSNDVAPLRGNPLDTLSGRLEEICSFQPGERDMVMLQHRFVVEWKDGSMVSKGSYAQPIDSPVSANFRSEYNHIHTRALRRPQWLLRHGQVRWRYMWHCHTAASRRTPSPQQARRVGAVHEGNLRSNSSKA